MVFVHISRVVIDVLCFFWQFLDWAFYLVEPDFSESLIQLGCQPSV